MSDRLKGQLLYVLDIPKTKLFSVRFYKKQSENHYNLL